MRKTFYAVAFALAGAMCLAVTVGAFAQSSIHTGGEKGAYHTVFGPPLLDALKRARFLGYNLKPSAGTLDNIQKVIAKPSDLAFVQLDVFAREAAASPEAFKKVVVVRQDIACEGLWMVVKKTDLNKDLQDYGAVLGYARRIPFILPPEGSGSAASFAYLQTLDPDGLGRAPKRNIRYAKDATSMLNEVASGDGTSIGFFVQFADPQNANIKLIVDKGLKAIPVVSREIVRAKVADKSIYEVQSFNLKEGFFAGIEETTSCTPVAVITGAPEALADKNDQEEQRDMIKRVAGIPSADLLPKESRFATIIKGAKRLGGKALDEMIAANELLKKKLEEQTR